MKKILLAFFSILLASHSFSQNVGIGTATPAASAKLDVSSTNSGLLIPRVALTITTSPLPITAPATSLLVYNTAAVADVTPGYYYWDGAVWARLATTAPSTDWNINGNTGITGTNFLGTINAADLMFRTTNIERMRVTTGGNVGIGITAPTQRFDVQGGNARINNAFIGDVGHGALWAGFANSSQIGTGSYTLLASGDGNYTLINKSLTGTGYIGFRINNNDVAVINEAGNMGIGTNAPVANARLQVVGGAIMPQTGNTTQSGIYFPPNPGAGGGDEAYIRHYVEAGENTKLVIANINDPDDDVAILTGLTAQERININGNGTVRLNRSVFYDCNDCGSTTGYDLADAAGANWGDLVIQGRVLSTNSNLHLSPPGGSRVVINSTYRSAGGAAGTTGLDIEDGGIRMRKNYMYFQRYLYCGGCYGVGSATYDLGNWDFCAVAQVGFRNTNSTTDEDDDVQCAVFPTAHGGAGEQTNYTSYYTYQFNAKPAWRMYFEAFADTNGITCAASCWNLE